MQFKAIPFDTLAYAKKLKGVGFTDAQAEVQAEAMAELMNDNLASKRDLEDVQLGLSRDIESLRLSLTKEIELVRLDIKAAENRMIIKMGAMMAAAIAIIAALVKLL